MIYAPEYIIHASWGPRAEPPESIAARYLACTDRLKQIHPAYDNWIFSLKKKPKKFDALRDDFAAAVAASSEGTMAIRSRSMAIGQLSPIQ